MNSPAERVENKFCVISNENGPFQCENHCSDIFGDVFEKNRSFFRNAALLAGLELGVFPYLTHPMTCEELSFALLGNHSRRLRALLNALVIEGYLHRQDGFNYGIAHVPDSKPALPKSGWGRLAEVIFTNEPLQDMDNAGSAMEMQARLHDHLFETGYPAALRLWRRLGIETGSLLDIGSGSGAYSAAFLDVNEDTLAALVDRDDVLELARRRLGKYASRVRFEKSDAFETVPGRYDFVLLANVLHLCGPTACMGLVNTAAQALVPGGRLIIKDLRIENNHTGPPVSVYFALNMALYTEAGDVYAKDDVCSWIRAVGLRDLHTVNDSRSLVIIASKR